MKYAVVFIGIFLFACGKGGDNRTHKEDIKLKQYMVAGQQLYDQHCSNCHQPDGKGLARLIPPLNESDFVDNNLEEVVCLMKYGISGPIEVNGVIFNQPMPGMPELTSLEIAELATFIYNHWGRSNGIISVKDADRILSKCDSRDIQ